MNSLFEVHILNKEGLEKAQKIAEAFDDLFLKLSVIGPNSGREVSIVRTKLEEAAFYAKKAMAMVPGNQQV